MVVKQAGIIMDTTVILKLKGSIRKYNGIVFCWCSQNLLFSIIITGSIFFLPYTCKSIHIRKTESVLTIYIYLIPMFSKKKTHLFYLNVLHESFLPSKEFEFLGGVGEGRKKGR